MASAGLETAVARELSGLLAADQLITLPEQLRTYECDGLTSHRVVPALVALPQSGEEVQAVVRACNTHGVPFVARGAGSGLSGGAVPVSDGVVISLARMTRIVSIDVDPPDPGDAVAIPPAEIDADAAVC